MLVKIALTALPFFILVFYQNPQRYVDCMTVIDGDYQNEWKRLPI